MEARWVAAALTLVAAVGSTAAARRDPAGPAGRAIRYGLATVLLGGVTAYLLAEAWTGRLSAWDFLPLHLCDFAIFLAAWALLTRSRGAAELVWFWAMSGTVLAIVTPDAPAAFPDWRWLAYFTMHGAVVTSAAVLALGIGLAPRPGGPWRAFGWTALYATLVGAVDWATGANYLFLRHKPARPTLLDLFGPWPLYIAVAGLVGLGLFWLLYLPFRGRRSIPASP
ncbi:MAG: TIGR02206 family membrane protein [Gemmatimonadota bacterium]|nr:TIGR02206 family membrane protein [Gemmatimonadota bacterium]